MNDEDVSLEIDSIKTIDFTFRTPQKFMNNFQFSLYKSLNIYLRT